MKKSLGHIGHVVKSFLNQHWDGQRPILIGYSGGPDSKALLYAALAWGGGPIHIAHVDHGWREESRKEAEDLKKEADLIQVPFHSIRLEVKTSEDEARQARLIFFQSLTKQYFFQAVLLGHQADDLAETVLKRLFEGAHLPQLGSMKEASMMDDLLIWRPLLNVSRSEIEKWLETHQLSFLTDPTNCDTTYLRARMRSSLIPQLSQTFGKNISKNLVVLSKRSQELEEYLEFRASQLQHKVVSGPFGYWVDGIDIHPMELRVLLQDVAQKEGIVFSRPILESIVDSMKRKVANCRLSINHRHIVVDRGHFFLLSKQMPRFGAPVKLILGKYQSGDWTVEVFSSEGGFSETCDWRDLCRGHFVFQHFDGEAFLQLPLSKMRVIEKIPAFLRSICPVLVIESGQGIDFLSKRMNGGKVTVKISIESEVIDYERDNGDSCPVLHEMM